MRYSRTEEIFAANARPRPIGDGADRIHDPINEPCPVHRTHEEPLPHRLHRRSAGARVPYPRSHEERCAAPRGRDLCLRQGARQPLSRTDLDRAGHQLRHRAARCVGVEAARAHRECRRWNLRHHRQPVAQRDRGQRGAADRRPARKRCASAIRCRSVRSWRSSWMRGSSTTSRRRRAERARRAHPSLRSGSKRRECGRVCAAARTRARGPCPDACRLSHTRRRNRIFEGTKSECSSGFPETSR